MTFFPFILCSLFLTTFSPKYSDCNFTTPPQPTQIKLITAIAQVFRVEPLLNIGNLHIYMHYNPLSVDKRQLNDILAELTRKLCTATCKINKHSAVQLPKYAHSNLVLVDTLESLRQLYHILLINGTLNLAHSVIYMSAQHDPQDAALQQLFQDFYDISILNVGVIMQLPSNELVMVSYQPFMTNACHHATTVIMNTYNTVEESWQPPKLFPRKLLNFHKCNITCATWEDLPYLWIHYDAAGNIVDFGGIEGKMLHFVAENLNISIGLYLMNNREIGEVYNKTGWIFHEIFHSAHFALGSFYGRPEYDGFPPYSQSDFYYMSPIFFVVSVLGDLSSYEKLSMPFNTHVWQLVALTLLISVIAILAASYAPFIHKHFIMGRLTNAPYYKLFSTALGSNVSQPQLPQRNFARFLLMVWLLSTLLLRTAYQSGMYHMLSTELRRYPPQTLDDIVTQKYKIEMHVDYLRLQEFLVELNGQQLNLFSINILQEIDRLTTMTLENYQKVAMLVAHEYYGYYRKLHPVKKGLHVSLHLVRQRLFNQQLTFYIRRNSYLVQVINTQIEKAQNYGFMQKWKRTYVDERDEGEKQGSEVLKKMPLTMHQLWSVFLILIWAHLISISFFVLEYVWGKQKSWSLNIPAFRKK